MNRVIRIGTRKSPLAVAQAELVVKAMKAVSPELQFEIVTRQTEGDRILDKSLEAFGGKGAFVAEFEQALLKDEIDFAVHSAKDLPMDLAEGLGLISIMKREDPRDVLVTPAASENPAGRKRVVVGTSSLRRKMQIERLGPELWPGTEVVCKEIRGNVQTRLGKMEAGEYDALILAAAGLKRLGLDQCGRYDCHYFDCEEFVPAGGQGILAVEGRIGDPTGDILRGINDERAEECLKLERGVLRLLDAGCHEPIGVYSAIDGARVRVRGISQRGEKIREVSLEGTFKEMDFLMEKAAGKLMEREM